MVRDKTAGCPNAFLPRLLYTCAQYVIFAGTLYKFSCNQTLGRSQVLQSPLLIWDRPATLLSLLLLLPYESLKRESVFPTDVSQHWMAMHMVVLISG